MFPNLDEHQFMSLTTYRKSGVAVPTPVWFAAQNGKLYVVSRGQAGKVKRVRGQSKVMVAPCTRDGQQLLGPAVEAHARILPENENAMAYQVLLDKYGQQLSEALSRDPEVKRSYIEIAPL